jgi:hypothetical protein
MPCGGQAEPQQDDAGNISARVGRLMKAAVVAWTCSAGPAAGVSAALHRPSGSATRRRALVGTTPAGLTNRPPLAARDGALLGRRVTGIEIPYVPRLPPAASAHGRVCAATGTGRWGRSRVCRHGRGSRQGRRRRAYRRVAEDCVIEVDATLQALPPHGERVWS